MQYRLLHSRDHSGGHVQAGSTVYTYHRQRHLPVNKRECTLQEAPEVEADVKNYKSSSEAARDIGRGIAAMRQTHRGPMLLVVQVRCASAV